MLSSLSTLAVLVINFLLVVTAYENTGCCYPDQLMGKAYLVEEKRLFTFAMDYKAGRFYRRVGDNSNWFHVIDLNDKLMYMVVNGQCSVKVYEDIPELVQCYSPEQWLTSFTVGGNLLTRRQKLHAFAYQLNGGIHVWKTVRQLGQTDRCAPVIVQSSEPGRRSNQTVVLSDLKPYIDIDAVHSSFANCRRHTVTPTPTPTATADEHQGQGYNSALPQSQVQGRVQDKPVDYEQGAGSKGSSRYFITF